MATSVFAAAANALEWVEVHRRDFGTARRFRDDEILRIGVGRCQTAGMASEFDGRIDASIRIEALPSLTLLETNQPGKSKRRFSRSSRFALWLFA